MTYKGKVENGVVVFDSEAPPDGTVVEVAAIASAAPQHDSSGQPRIWSRLLKLRGQAPDLPGDAAAQHDHYLYGTPKR